MPIRVRAALVFVTALAIAFGLGGWLFYTQLSASLLPVFRSKTPAALSAVPPRGC